MPIFKVLKVSKFGIYWKAEENDFVALKNQDNEEAML